MKWYHYERNLWFSENISKNNLEVWIEDFWWKGNIYIYILLMNKTIVMKRRRIGIMLSSLDDDGIMIEMMTENVRRRDIILYI